MSAPQIDEKSIFNVARKIESPDARKEYLDQVCGDDSDLMSRVANLLQGLEGRESFLEQPAPGLAATVELGVMERPGLPIGPYKLLQEIGHGGMGVVYMAEQTEPVERRVALKIIKPGMDTRQVIARFEAERQALAMMDHPNIAKVLDAGATESGGPYFVMELVNGIPLTEYCDEQHLHPKERLELFLPVCQAVQHAHQKGIIHRDLKPSNILVALYDHEPVPKVIDFGVAKATSQSLTEKTLFTQFGQVVGTLEYMSPEQARRNQLDVDTRCDIYALGVLLYELLTGTTPFDKQRLRSASFDEVLRIIREEEPPRPSTRLSSIETLPSVAISRRTEPRKLRTLVRGELDWIVMKALDKDRSRRYETAIGFAADVERYLRNEAVLACPPSIVYRSQKFVKRHRAALLTASLVAVALLLGLAGMAWQVARTKHAERQIRAEELVKSLQTMDVATIPTTVASDLESLRRWADPLLMDEIAKAADGSAAKLHLSLALLPVDDGQIGYLSAQLPICQLDQFLVVRDALLSHKNEITGFLWQVAQDERQGDRSRLQAAAALATYDAENARWREIRGRVARHLVTVDLSLLGSWKDVFLPVAEMLVEPLSNIYQDLQPDDVARSLAAALLVEYAKNDVETLTSLVSYSDEKTFNVLYSALHLHAAEAVKQLELLLEELAGDQELERLAQRQANAAIALLRLDEHDTVWPLLKLSPDPRLRTWIIHRVCPLGVAYGVIAEGLQTETDDSIRRALILALGEFKTISLFDKASLVRNLLDLYEHDRDPGIHAAVEWTLRKWKRDGQVADVAERLAGGAVSEGFGWYVTRQGHTMVRFPGPIEFDMGSPDTEKDRYSHEAIHRKRIDRSFAVATKEVTVKEFGDFLQDVQRERYAYTRSYAPDDHCPQMGVSWYEAAAYCRWLSEKEGIPLDQMCYPEIPAIQEGLKLPANYLSRTGYRLPTEAEWEYACRATTATAFCYGQSEDLLGQYCWYAETAKSRTWPVGSLKPNDFGLFDMHGNVHEWCQEAWSHPVAAATADPDTEDRLAFSDKLGRVLRGGSFLGRAHFARSASRTRNLPGVRNLYFGFRIARTVD